MNDTSAEASTSGASSDTSSQDIIDIEGGEALATAWGRKLRDWAGAGWADVTRTYVVKPSAVGLSTVSGEFVYLVTGLPQAAMTAWSLLSQVSFRRSHWRPCLAALSYNPSCCN